MLEKLKSLRGSMSTPQLISLVVTFLGVVGAVFAFAYWINQPTYRVLFSDMDAESASAVTQRLRDQKVTYQLTEGGRSIQVPADQLDELRLGFAGAGLPQSGRLGFEIFDRTQFGTTEFLEGVTYRRALEGEIARTIATIAEVASARVHIALAKDSLFQSKDQPAKASVVLRLKGRTPLGQATVGGIRSLVAFAVEGLRPELVAIIDTDGRPLTNADTDGEPLGAAQAGRQQQFERDLAARVVSLLEPVVGVDRVRVNVAARLNIDAEDRVEETWDPSSTVIRSRVASLNSTGGVGVSQGVAGARANLPTPVPSGSSTPAVETPPAAAGLGTTGGAQNSTETVNYEVSKVTRHTQRPRGDVARLSVAVILDDGEVVKKEQDGSISRDRKPRDPTELQKINALVAAAVGLDTQRGDQLTVENISFEQQVYEAPVAAPPGVMPLLPKWGWIAVGVGAALLIGGLAIVVLTRRTRPSTRHGEVSQGSMPSTELLPPQQLPKTVAEIEGEIALQLDHEAETNGSDRRVPVMTKRLNGLISKDPDAAARLVHSWLADEKKAS